VCVVLCFGPSGLATRLPVRLSADSTSKIMVSTTIYSSRADQVYFVQGVQARCYLCTKRILNFSLKDAREEVQ
jgi:PP-loop superfamily ATP-utilizing enzyme